MTKVRRWGAAERGSALLAEGVAEAVVETRALDESDEVKVNCHGQIIAKSV